LPRASSPWTAPPQYAESPRKGATVSSARRNSAACSDAERKLAWNPRAPLEECRPFQGLRAMFWHGFHGRARPWQRRVSPRLRGLCASDQLSVAAAQVANAIVARASNGGEKKLQALGQIAIGISKTRVYERVSGSGSRRSNGSARIQPAAPSGHA
jgi:hypothetical protein